MNMNILEKIGLGIILTIGVIGFLASLTVLLAFPIKWIWNAIMPYLFGWK